MITDRENQHLERGSAHIWIIAVLVLVIIGLLGLVFWQQLTKSNNPKNSNTSQNSSKPESDQTAADQTNLYQSNDSSAYVKSFKYPATWQVVEDGDKMCETFNYCTSPPVVLLADKDNTVRVIFYAPQSAASDSIDNEASDLAGKDGKVVPNFTSLDGVQARKIAYSNGKVTVLVTLRGGYGGIDFLKPVDTKSVDTILSSWKW